MTIPNTDPSYRSPGAAPDGEGKGSTQRKIDEDARALKREGGTKVREQAEVAQDGVVDEANALSDAIGAAASALDDNDREGLARYARQLSVYLSRAAAQLEDRSVNDLVNDAKTLARDHPELFMLGSVGVGFGLSRFFKASSTRATKGHATSDQTETADSQAKDLHSHNLAGTESATVESLSRNGDGRSRL